MKQINKILLRRKNLLMVQPANSEYQQSKNELALVVTMMKNVQSLGYTFSKELFDVLCNMNSEELKAFYLDTIPALKELVGADVTYTPMYPNFPTQVAEADGVELFINAIVHYWSLGKLIPEYQKDERLPLIDDNKMTLLSVGNHEDLMQIFSNLVSSKTSLSEQDKEDITEIVKNCADYADYLPNEIPFKENVALIGKLIIENAPIKSAKAIKKYFKTATDVLRLITALSDGDISLASKTKYRSLRRCERRIILDLLANCGNILEDLFRYKFEWIRIGEIIHPFEYWQWNKYNKVRGAFYIIRNEKKPLMFGGKVQAAILRKDMTSAADLLKLRPGEFARQLDKVLRDSANKQYVVDAFADVASEISTPVLLQVRQHFIGRMAEIPNPVRVFFPKGNLAKAKSIKNELPAIDKTICQNVIRICCDALVEKYKTKEEMGKVFVDDDFKNFIVPFSQRSASSTSKSVVRGSKLPIKTEATAVRAFIWWTNTAKSNGWDGGRVDIDLSAAIFDSDWNFVEHVSYTRLRSEKLKAYHSGDITDGGKPNGKGVAEFLDVDIDAVAKNGRYIVYQVYNYTGQKYCDIENCRFGWMERADVDSGEIFEPTTVDMIMDVNAESTVAIPVIFDCVERKFIWCDMNLGIDSTKYRGNNLERNLSGVNATCYAMTHLNKTNLYDLAMLNALARGTITSNRNEAQIIFSNDKTIPYDIVIEKDKDGNEIKAVKEKPEVPIITSFDVDYAMANLL